MPQIARKIPIVPGNPVMTSCSASFEFETISKDKPDISELYRKTSQPVAVLGGGPSLPSDMAQIPEDCLLISCNHHAFRLCSPDYMAFIDDPDMIKSIAFRSITISCSCPKISVNLKWTDYYCLNEFPINILHPLGVSDTGMFGTWLASYITSGPVYLCGMDITRNNGQEHFYQSDSNSGWKDDIHLESKLIKWQHIINFCENVERIKAISGPLQKVLNELQ